MERKERYEQLAAAVCEMVRVHPGLTPTDWDFVGGRIRVDLSYEGVRAGSLASVWMPQGDVWVWSYYHVSEPYDQLSVCTDDYFKFVGFIF